MTNTLHLLSSWEVMELDEDALLFVTTSTISSEFQASTILSCRIPMHHSVYIQCDVLQFYRYPKVPLSLVTRWFHYLGIIKIVFQETNFFECRPRCCVRREKHNLHLSDRNQLPKGFSLCTGIFIQMFRQNLCIRFAGTSTSSNVCCI